MGMFLGLLGAGMGLGALAAGTWIMYGGSVVAAVAIYSLVATCFVLGAAILSFLMSRRKAKTSCATDALTAAE